MGFYGEKKRGRKALFESWSSEDGCRWEMMEGVGIVWDFSADNFYSIYLCFQKSIKLKC